MSWGDALSSAYNAATDAARQAGASMMSSAASAASAADAVSRAADAAGITGRAAAGVATAPYRAARNLLAPAATPAQTLVEPCPDTWAGKKARQENASR